MAEGPSGFASSDFRIGDRVRFMPHAEVSERLLLLPAVVEGYDMTQRRTTTRQSNRSYWVEDVHVIVSVDLNGVQVEQWVAPDQLARVH